MQKHTVCPDKDYLKSLNIPYIRFDFDDEDQLRKHLMSAMLCSPKEIDDGGNINANSVNRNIQEISGGCFDLYTIGLAATKGDTVEAGKIAKNRKPHRQRSTWESPNGEYNNEIDHIIVNRKFCLTDVAVVPKFYTGSDHRLLRARFYFSRKGEKAAKFKNRCPRTTTNWDLFNSLVGCWEDAVVDNIDEEYDRLIEHLHVSAMKAERSKVTKRRMFQETLELIRQRGIVRAAGNSKLTSELAKQCRLAIKDDLKERRAAVMVEAADAGKSIRKARRSFANYKNKMIALRRPDGTITASRKAMEEIIHEYYSDHFDSHVHLPSYEIKEDGYAVPPVLLSEIRHAISSNNRKNRTAPGPDRIRSEHLKNVPPVLVSTLARLFSRYLSECKIPTQWKTSKTVLLFKKGDLHDIGNYHPICLLSVVCKLFIRVILNRIDRTLDEGQPC